MELIDVWKYQDGIRRRRARGVGLSLGLAVVLAVTVLDDEIRARISSAAFPESPAGRWGAVHVLDLELDKALAAYRNEESAHRHIAGHFETLGARDDGLAGEAIQREVYLEAMKKHILTLQAERRQLAVKAGVGNRVDREIDYFTELDNDGQ